MKTKDNLKKFRTYIENVVSQDKLESIENKIKTIIKFYKGIQLDKVDEIFISDFIDDNEKERKYDDLWLFSNNYWVEARGFGTKYDYIIINSNSIRVSHINIKKRDYDFNKAKGNSRMSLYVYLNTDLLLTLKATGENCNYLKNIILKYFMPCFEKL